MTQVQARYFALQGGLDLVSPPGMIDAGRASEMRNYEVTITGGYRRVDGYERLDGRPAPHMGNAVAYAEVLNIRMMMEPDYPAFVTGTLLIEPAILRIPLFGLNLDLGQVFDYKNQFAIFVHGNPVATYLIGEFPTEASLMAAITAIPGVQKAEVVDGVLEITSVLEPVNHVHPSLALMAADFQDMTSWANSQQGRRSAIQPLPGEGPVRGVAVFNGTTIAARDNGPNGFLYVATENGWSGLILPHERMAGGQYQFAVGNFTGNPGDLSLFVVDGINPPLQIKGPDFVVQEILDCKVELGALTLYPSYVEIHKNHLFVGYPSGSIQFSGIGDPYSWSTTDGAGEIALGEELTGLKSLQGDALGLFTKDGVRVLYGTSSADWELSATSTGADGVGALPGTIQTLGQPLFADRLGIRTLAATNTYGNFAASTLSVLVKPLYDTLVAGGVKASFTCKSLNQYRLLFAGGQCLTMTSDGSKLLGFGYSKYLFDPTCAAQGEDAEGRELVVVGAEDGNVYRMNVGTSFDGEPIDAALRLHFNHVGSPRRHKRFRLAIWDMHVPVAFPMHCHYALNYGGGDHAQAVDEVTKITGSYGVWNVDEWGEFNWGGNELSEGEVEITGSGRTIALLLYCEGDQIPPFRIDGVTLHYSLRRLQR